MRFLTVGSVAVDTIETAAEKKERIMGGSANYSSAAAMHFVTPLMVGIIGNDYPQEWLELFEEKGADTSGVRRADGMSFFWHGRYNDDFSTRTSIATQLGVFEKFEPVLPEHFRGARFVFLANIEPGLQKFVLDQLTSPAFVAMDTMNYWIERARDKVVELIRRVDCILINDEELEQLTGRASPFSGLRKLKEMGARSAVVKLGKWGSILLAGDGFFWAPAYPVENVVDPTGAGDTYAGAFTGCLAAYGHRTPRDFKRAALYASAMASFTVESFEPRALMAIEKRLINDRYMFLKELINY
ncbi:MAG: PfkB family carbohydrate kinase [Pseudomonadota bacterium]